MLHRHGPKEFSGTDRLPKSVGPEFRAWLTNMADTPANIDWVVYWEGERFSNSKCLDCMMHSRFNTRLFLLEVWEEEMTIRQESRVQNPSWLRGMKTRMANIDANYIPIHATNESIGPFLYQSLPGI